MVQDKHFVDISTLLFDGETGLKSKKAQHMVLDKYQIKLYADPGSKRNQAERYIKGTVFCSSYQCFLLIHFLAF